MNFFKKILNSPKFKSILFLVPFIVTLLFYQQCSRNCPVEVNHSPSGSSAVIPLCAVDANQTCINEGKSCDNDHSDGDTWFEKNEEIISVQRNCPYGDIVTDEFYQEEEYICLDGHIRKSGNLRNGHMVNAGQCQSVPFNCGIRLDGTTWWETEEGLTKLPRACSPQSPDVFNYYKTEQELRCENGTIIPTGEKRLTTLEYIDNCPAESNCGNHSEGSIWYEGEGTIQSPRTCRDNYQTQVFDIFVRLKELRCVDGNIIDLDITKIGNLISYGECPLTLKCGNRNEGEIWSEEIIGEYITENFTCSDQVTPAASLYKKIQIKQCLAGNEVIKEMIKGDLVTSGICPRPGCDQYLDGEKWLRDIGLEIQLSKECTYGPFTPPATISYINFQEVICQNGEVTETGNYLRGDKKSETSCYQCEPNSRRFCYKDNGSGSELCKADGSGYNDCVVSTCKAGYYLDNGHCLPVVCIPRSKTRCESTQNSHWSKTCKNDGSGHHPCAFDSCRPGFVRRPTPGNQKEVCVPFICNPGFIDKVWCKEKIPGGLYQRTCNQLGTEFSPCEAKCLDGKPLINGKCGL